MNITEASEYLNRSESCTYRLLREQGVRFTIGRGSGRPREYNNEDVKKLKEWLSLPRKRKYVWTEEGRKQRSESMKRWWASLTEEQRAERGRKQISRMLEYWQTHEVVTK